MRGMSNDPARAIEIQGVMTALHVLRVLTPELSAIASALDKKIESLPSFFANAPVAIDLRDLEPDGELPRMGSGRLRLGPLVDLLKTRGLVPVAIRGGVSSRVEEARTLGLGVLEWDRAGAAKKPPSANSANADAPATKQPTATARVTSSAPSAPPQAATPPAPPAPNEPTVSLVLSQPLRSGQIVYADDGRDAIALAAVNQGAELIADGNIHVYSTLRGRALAGARGNDQARIFCQRLEAELISIAGVYVNADELPKDKLGKPAQISLRDGSLVISELATR
jgi:septum site-determining protein MinC